MVDVTPNTTTEVYHERQHLQLCALHALNNLFQKCEFTKKYLDDVCEQLSASTWFNPHRSMFGLGNYDVNVLMKALNNKGFEMLWFDKRKNVESLEFRNAFGLILNVPSKCKLGFVPLPMTRPHWVAIRQIHQTYYNFDSKNDFPELIGQVIN